MRNELIRVTTVTGLAFVHCWCHARLRKFADGGALRTLMARYIAR